MPDLFYKQDSNLESPAAYGYNAVANNASDLPFSSRFLHIGTGGTLNVIFVNDSTNTSITAATGVVLPFRVKKIWATGTTATGIVVAY